MSTPIPLKGLTAEALADLSYAIAEERGNNLFVSDDGDVVVRAQVNDGLWFHFDFHPWNYPAVTAGFVAATKAEMIHGIRRHYDGYFARKNNLDVPTQEHNRIYGYDAEAEDLWEPRSDAAEAAIRAFDFGTGQRPTDADAAWVWHGPADEDTPDVWRVVFDVVGETMPDAVEQVTAVVTFAPGSAEVVGIRLAE